ncbi:hypothetical protein [Haloparvum sedimenti]|uniref:hypothetical protein n=1 Tax=Haloparvum sedimenti TaxID=1678448 RepID=UPI00071E92FA|nr:hypothetical protein [Haloparvum sedimenti]
MTLVVAVSALAALGRAERLDVLAGVDEEVLVPETVFDTLAAAAPETPPASALVRLGDADALRAVAVSDAPLYERLRTNDRLADADAAAVALADLVSGALVAEEPYLGRIAAAEGVPTTTVPGVLSAAVANGDLPAPRALDAFDDLLDAGWYGRPDLYAAFISALDAAE